MEAYARDIIPFRRLKDYSNWNPITWIAQTAARRDYGTSD
jgi:hypothetical protein